MKDKYDEDYREEIHEMSVEEIDRMTVEQMKDKIENNKKQIKKAKILNPLMSVGFIGFGILSAFFAPGIGQWGFPVIAATALASSNGWAVEVIVKLTNENKKLEKQIEIKPLKQKIHQIEQEICLKKQTNQATLSDENVDQKQSTQEQQLPPEENKSQTTQPEQDLSM